MVVLRRLFTRDPPAGDDGGDTEVNPSLGSGENLEAEYETLIANQCRRWGISSQCVTVQVRHLGRAGDGRMVYVGMLRLVRWDRFAGLRVLIGLPLLEGKLRRIVRNTWLGEVSHFGGLWLHASEQLSHSTAMTELRDLMLQLTPLSSQAAGHAGAEEAISSLPDPGASKLPPSSGGLTEAALGPGGPQLPRDPQPPSQGRPPSGG